MALLLQQCLSFFQKTIDVLKFDIEYSEWGALEAMKREGCLKHVRQMVFEIHMWTDENPFRTSLLPKFGFPLKKVPYLSYLSYANAITTSTWLTFNAQTTW